MNQVTQLLTTIGPLLLIALKCGLVIGGTGSLLEAIGNWRNLPKLIAIGQKLEAIGADIPKLVGKVQTLLPPPYTPTNSRPFPGSDPEPTQTPPRSALIGLALAALLVIPGCGLLSAAYPVIAEAGVVIADAINAVDAAQALLPTLHLDASQEAAAEDVIARARKALAAAAEADQGAKDLTEEQLDASLAAFRAAWQDLETAIKSKRAGASAGVDDALPVPLAVRRVVHQ